MSEISTLLLDRFYFKQSGGTNIKCWEFTESKSVTGSVCQNQLWSPESRPQTPGSEGQGEV